MLIQYKKLVDMVSLIVGRLHEIDAVKTDICEMGRRHVNYGVKPEHYKAVGDTLLWTLKQGLGQDWNADVQEAWATCYQLVAGIMIDASG